MVLIMAGGSDSMRCINIELSDYVSLLFTVLAALFQGIFEQEIRVSPNHRSHQRSSEGCQRAVRSLSKGCHRVVRRLSHTV